MIKQAKYTFPISDERNDTAEPPPGKKERRASDNFLQYHQGLKDLSEHEYLNRMEDGPRKENFKKRLKVAKNGCKRFEQAIVNAPEDIKHVLLEETAGREIQLLYLELKPAAFGIHATIHIPLRTDLPHYESKIQNKKDIASLSRRVRNYIASKDPKHDLYTADFHDREDYIILPSGTIQLQPGGHAIYSLKSTIKIANTYPDLFSNKLSKNSIHLHIYDAIEANLKHRKDLTEKKGLLCGFPDSAVQYYIRQIKQNGKIASSAKSSEIRGMRFFYKELDPNIQTFIDDHHAIYRFSGVENLILSHRKIR